MRRFLQHRSIQTFLAIVIYLLLAPVISKETSQMFYSISLFIKDILLWTLPITICCFIAHTVSSFEKRAPLFILTLFVFEALSNGLSVWYAYVCGYLAEHAIPPASVASVSVVDSFSPLWRLPLVKPSWWSADKGTFVGLFLGIIAAFTSSPLKRVISKGKEYAEYVLTRIFSRLIPIFIVGFIAKMHRTSILNGAYVNIFFLLIFFLVVYIAFLFILGSGFSLKSIKNLLPAGGIAFSSGCSLSTMPWTIEGATKNLKNKELAKAIIPATTNIQQIGDCIANAFLCFLIYRHFNGFAPPLTVWLAFSSIFVLARFATAAVIGGAIFVMLPIYEGYLGFNAEMIALILAFNVILDPIITSANVMANGALCRVFEKVWSFVLKEEKAQGSTPTLH